MEQADDRNQDLYFVEVAVVALQTTNARGEDEGAALRVLLARVTHAALSHRVACWAVHRVEVVRDAFLQRNK